MDAAGGSAPMPDPIEKSEAVTPVEQTQFTPELTDFLMEASRSAAEEGDLDSARAIGLARESLSRPNQHGAALATAYLLTERWEGYLKGLAERKASGTPVSPEEEAEAEKSLYHSRRIFFENCQIAYPAVPAEVAVQAEDPPGELSNLSKILSKSSELPKLIERIESVEIVDRVKNIDTPSREGLTRAIDLINELSWAASIGLEETLREKAKTGFSDELSIQLNIGAQEMYRLQLLRDELERRMGVMGATAPAPAPEVSLSEKSTEQNEAVDPLKAAEDFWNKYFAAKVGSFDKWFEGNLPEFHVDIFDETPETGYTKWRGVNNLANDLRPRYVAEPDKEGAKSQYKIEFYQAAKEILANTSGSATIEAKEEINGGNR